MVSPTEALDFVWKRIPNMHEVITINGLNSIIDLTLSPWLVSFGTHPGSKNIIRDVTKLPSLAILSYNNDEIGQTGYRYDAGYLAASLTKIVCKGVIISGSAYWFGHKSVEISSRVSNFVCEMPSRYLILASMDRQKHNATDSNFFKYIYQNNNLVWVEGAIGESVPKVLVSDLVGELIKRFDLKGAANTANGWLHQWSANIFGVEAIDPDIAGDSNAWMHFAHYTKKVAGHALYAVYGVSAGIDYITKISYETIISYTMMPLARCIQDGVGLIIESYAHEVQDEAQENQAAVDFPLVSKEDICPNKAAELIFYEFIQHQTQDQSSSLSEKLYSASDSDQLYGVCPVGELY